MLSILNWSRENFFKHFGQTFVLVSFIEGMLPQTRNMSNNIIYKSPAQIVLETLDRLNRALESDPNAMVTTISGEGAHPEAAYAEVVQKLLKLAET